ncbi:MAG: hypothetical protein KKD74_14090 [Bacteroidetes bacterium]|nr:hypothetical protein [Bacteroidota bacterium]
MNITKDQTSELTATLQLTLQQVDYEETVTKELKDYQRKASMPGFRPGKVPFGMVKKMYGKALLADKVNKLVSDALNNYIIDNKIAILGHPVANMEKTGTIDFDQPGDFNFFFDIGYAPAFELDLAKTGTIDYPKIQAGDDMIDKAIADLQKRHGKHTHPENVTEQCNVSGKLTDEAITDGLAIEFAVSDVADASVKAELIGKAAGNTLSFEAAKAFGSAEKAIELLKLSDDNKALAEKTMLFTLEEIHLEEAAEINDELFKAVFPDDELADVTAFRKRVAADIEKQFEQETDRYFLNKAVEALIESHHIELPDSFMKNWIVENSEGKVSLEQLETQYDSYARTFRWQLIEGKLVEANENLAVKEADIRNFVKSYFFGGLNPSDQAGDEMNNRLEGIVDMVLKNKDEERRIADQLAEQKLAAFMKANISKTEKVMTYDEYVKLISDKATD